MKSRLMRGPMTFVPTDLAGLAAWYDVSDETTIKYDTSNRVSLLSDKSGNSAVNCLVLNGLVGNYASSPDSSAYTADDYDIRVDCARNTWNPSGESWLVTQYGYSDNNRSWAFGFEGGGGNGFLTFRISINGVTATVSPTSSVATGFSAYQRGQVRVTYQRNTGSGSWEAKFFIRTDGVLNSNIGWTQLGLTRGGTSIAQAFSSSSPLLIGAIGNTVTNTGYVDGRFYRTWVATTIDGAPVFDANFSLAPKLATSFTESSSNAATVTINTSGATGARISGERDLYQGTVANQPIYLPYTGSKYAYLSGLTGNQLSTPNADALNITGDIDLRARVQFASWTGLTQEILTKGTVSNAYRMRVESSGRIGFYFVGGNFNGGSVLPFSNNQIGWIRVTRRVSDGFCETFYSTDGINWVSTGSAITTPGVLGTDAGALNIGAASASMGGNIYRAQVYNGINGTLAFDFNAENYTTGSTLLDASANAATITINNGATIVTAPALYFDGSNDYLKAPPFALSQPETVQFVGGQVTWANNDNIVAGGRAGVAPLAQSSVSPSVGAYAGITFSPLTTAWAIKTLALASAIINGTSSGVRINKGTLSLGGTGSFAPDGVTIGADGGAANVSNITTNEIAIYSAARSTAQLNLFADYASRKWGFNV